MVNQLFLINAMFLCVMVSVAVPLSFSSVKMLSYLFQSQNKMKKLLNKFQYVYPDIAVKNTPHRRKRELKNNLYFLSFKT